ncbi:MAG: tRNA-dihydrouridine synthase [Caulobacteraceae bacterium]|nr:tRNA-dihydrouridine synthase [Caulobacteraceae bacterium]
MTGISDLPFRLVASRLGAGYVATEMVASEGLAEGRPDALRRAAVGEGLPLMVVQLVGADPAAVGHAAGLAAAAGAHIVDLNFGCPAKSVTGIACGSALMRRPDLAVAIVEAAVEGAGLPVTVKMRLGWDDASRNAPDLAARCQAAGARAVTVHARTRAQGYGGVADWAAVREVVAAVSVPVVVGGDIVDAQSARRALDASGADAVMIGRAAIGRPWLAACVEARLAGRPVREPEGEARVRLVLEHLAESVRFHGERLGVRTFRKHLAHAVETADSPVRAEARRAARARVCRLDAPADIAAALAELWPEPRRLAA